MAPAMIGLLLVSSGLGVHLEDVVDLPLRDAAAVAESLARAVEPYAGLRARVDDPLSPRCVPPGRCVGDVAVRTAAEHLIFVRLIGGVTRIRVRAIRTDPSGRRLAEASVDLSRSAAAWPAPIDRLARLLFPSPLGERSMTPGRDRLSVDPVAGAAKQAVAPEGGPSVSDVGPWVSLGLGVAAGATGAAFGASSAAARDRIETDNLVGSEYTDALGQMRDHGTAANILLGVAAGAVITGVVWLIVR